MNVLLPIDGSDCSTQTLQWAAETFDKTITRYYLLFVIHVLPDLDTMEYDIVEASIILRRTKNLLEDLGCIVEKAEYVLGDPVEQICRYADEMKANQIVMGSHGRTGLAKLLMGSVSMKVLEQSHRPVTVHRNVESGTKENKGITINTAI